MDAKQLTFVHLKNRVTVDLKTGMDVRPNPSVTRTEIRRLKHQADEIYMRLRKGPVWTSELSFIAKQYNARIKEIREMLRDSGMTVDCTFKGRDGNNRYEIRPIHGSNYQKSLMKRHRGTK